VNPKRRDLGGDKRMFREKRETGSEGLKFEKNHEFHIARP